MQLYVVRPIVQVPQTAAEPPPGLRVPLPLEWGRLGVGFGAPGRLTGAKNDCQDVPDAVPAVPRGVQQRRTMMMVMMMVVLVVVTVMPSRAELS